jgi:Cytochrome P450
LRADQLSDLLLREVMRDAECITLLSTEALGRNRELRRRLVADPSLVPAAVEEFLRMWSPFQGLARYVAQDCSLGGQTIKAGERVLLLFGSANRDETEFDHAGFRDVNGAGAAATPAIDLPRTPIYSVYCIAM